MSSRQWSPVTPASATTRPTSPGRSRSSRSTRLNDRTSCQSHPSEARIAGMTVPPRVNLITLGVTDIERATQFYQALGWRLSGSSVSGEVSFFDLTNCVLAVWGHASLAEDARLPAG